MSTRLEVFDYLTRIPDHIWCRRCQDFIEVAAHGTHIIDHQLTYELMVRTEYEAFMAKSEEPIEPDIEF